MLFPSTLNLPCCSTTPAPPGLGVVGVGCGDGGVGDEQAPQLWAQFCSIHMGLVSHSPLAAQAPQLGLLSVHGAGGVGAGGEEQALQLRRQFSSIQPGLLSHSPMAAQSGHI